MHPRNIYRTPPDFSALASKYPEFAKISTLDLNGAVSINFKDLNSLRILTKYLLLSDFDLNVDIPCDRLIPTVPLRLNYLLWLEDLLNEIDKKTDIIGIDIGTGACCIYPLLAAKKFKWKMIGTEIDEKSLSIARQNINKNNLEDFITLCKVKSDECILLNCFSEFGGSLDMVDFCMCNPPFFSSIDDIDPMKNPSRPPPSNAHSGSFEEIVTPGGEGNFIRRLIEESLIIRDKVSIYTTMLGHKATLKPLINLIEAYGIPYIAHTTFHQGKTTRWGLAWSFKYSVILSQQLSMQKSKGNKPLSFIIPPLEQTMCNVNEVTKKIVSLLNSLEIEIKILQKKSHITLMEIRAEKNTWSNQRRKKRQMKFKEMDDTNKILSNDQESKKRKIDSIPSNSNTSCKRLCVASNENNEKSEENLALDYNSQIPKENEPSSVKTKFDCSIVNNYGERELNCDSSDSAGKESSSSSSRVCPRFLTGAVCIREYESSVLLEMGYLDGSSGKDGIHQIIQYLKNNWK